MEWTFSFIKDALAILSIGFNIAMFIVVKFNDLSHLEKGVNELKKVNKEEHEAIVNALKEMDKKQDQSAERLAAIETSLDLLAPKRRSVCSCHKRRG